MLGAFNPTAYSCCDRNSFSREISPTQSNIIHKICCHQLTVGGVKPNSKTTCCDHLPFFNTVDLIQSVLLSPTYKCWGC